MQKSKLRYNISINHCDLHNLSLQQKYCSQSKTAVLEKKFLIEFCGTRGGFTVMFMFRFNLNSKLRFIVSSARMLLLKAYE